MLSMNGSYKHTILSRRPFNTFAEFSSNNPSSRWPGIRTHNSASPQPHASPHNRHLAFRCLKSAFKSIAYWAMALYQFLTYLLKKQVRAIQKWQPVRYDLIAPSPLTLSRINVVKRKIMVLDLDETLIHSHHDGLLRPSVKPGTPPDFILKVVIDNQQVRFYVHLRPHVEYFLSIVSQWFDLVIFTASMEIYGASVADKLDDGRGILQRRYYRQHCTQEFNGYTKDLSTVHPDLSSIFILDNSPSAYRNFMQNAIPIKSWFCDPHDTCLLDILPFLDALRLTSDVRSILGRNIHRPPPAPPFFNFNPFSNLPSSFSHSDDPMADYPDYDMNMSMNGRDNEYETTDDDDVDPPQLMSTSSSSYHTNLSFFTQNNNYIHVG